MIHIDPKEVETARVHGYLLGGVGPRPIALVSTMSADGIPNLSPFSFFNAFSADPPLVIFSASRRIRDNTVKDSFNNLVATRECVIQAVTYDMVHQISLASSDYEKHVDEFVKSGLTPVTSDIVKPYRVAESPFQMECRLKEMISLSNNPGAGNLALCEVVRFHIAEHIMEDGIIQSDRIDLVGRMGGPLYARASGDAVFAIPKPSKPVGMGFDNLPVVALNSDILTGNQLAQLAGKTTMPATADAEQQRRQFDPVKFSREEFADLAAVNDYRRMYAMALATAGELFEACILLTVSSAIAAGDIDFAWNALRLLIPDDK